MTVMTRNHEGTQVVNKKGEFLVVASWFLETNQLLIENEFPGHQPHQPFITRRDIDRRDSLGGADP